MVEPQKSDVYAIKLKVELAKRLINSDKDAANEELRQVLELVTSMIAPRTRRDLPAPPSLTTEIKNAKQLFEAVGATVHHTHEDGPAPLIDEPIRLVLGEAVTNILSHANPSMISIVVAETGMSILNNGVEIGPAQPLKRLAELQREIEKQGGELIAVKNRDTFLTAVTFSSPRLQVSD